MKKRIMRQLLQHRKLTNQAELKARDIKANVELLLRPEYQAEVKHEIAMWFSGDGSLEEVEAALDKAMKVQKEAWGE